MRTKQGHVGPVDFSTLSAHGHSSLEDLPSIHVGGVSVEFYGGVILWKLRRFLTVRHPHCRRLGAFASFYEADGPVYVVSSLSLLSISQFLCQKYPYQIYIWKERINDEPDVDTYKKRGKTYTGVRGANLRCIN